MKPEETPKPEELAPAGDSYPNEPVLPDGFTPLGDISNLPRARRRRARRMLAPPGASERAALLEGLARRAFPSLEFFLFAFLSGTILSAGYLIDLKANSQALILLGLLLAPLLTPWVGMTLAAITGSWRFFIQTLGGLAVAALLVFLVGGLAGLVGQLWLPLPGFSQLYIHSHLWWPDLLIVVLGAALLTLSFTRSEQKLILPSIMLAYGLFMPLSAAGFGMGIGMPDVVSNGLMVSLAHLTLSTLVGGIVLAIMRFRPARASGYLLLILIGLGSLTGVVMLTGLPALIRDGITSSRHPASTSVALPSLTAGPPQSPTPTGPPASSATAASTLTPEPTASYAVIGAETGGGATVRSEPGGGSVITVLLNGYIVQVLPDIQSVGAIAWVRVRLADGIEGWVLQSVLHAATVTPTSAPSLTPTPSQAP
jgi:hypothetical protein